MSDDFHKATILFVAKSEDSMSDYFYFFALVIWISSLSNTMILFSENCIETRIKKKKIIPINS